MNILLGIREALEAGKEFDEKFLLNYLSILIDAKTRPGISQGELAGRTRLSKAGISRAMGAMGAWGPKHLTLRSPVLRIELDGDDRRVNHVYLTKAGEDLLKRIEQAFTRVQERNK